MNSNSDMSKMARSNGRVVGTSLRSHKLRRFVSRSKMPKGLLKTQNVVLSSSLFGNLLHLTG